LIAFECLISDMEDVYNYGQENLFTVAIGYPVNKFEDDPDIQFIWDRTMSSVMNQGWI
jgi:hypothetical protein